MADYYPLISRALDGLSDKSSDMRRAVYERARTAWTELLQPPAPPLPTAEITRERLALDEAIDRIEAEYALGEASLDPAAEPDHGRALPEAAPPPGRIRSESIRDPFAERDLD